MNRGRKGCSDVKPKQGKTSSTYGGQKNKVQSKNMRNPSHQNNNYFDSNEFCNNNNVRDLDNFENSDGYSVAEFYKRGEEIYRDKHLSNSIINLIESNLDCFNSVKRAPNLSYKRQVSNNPPQPEKNKLQERPNLGRKTENLPEWFDNTPSEKVSVFFDYSSTVGRTKLLNKEIVQKVTKQETELNSTVEIKKDVDLDEIDNRLEKNFIIDKLNKSKVESVEDLYNFELENDISQIDLDEESKDQVEGFISSPLNKSANDSVDYFGNLQENIKALLLNQNESSSEEEKESEESFQETLGFEYNRDHPIKSNNISKDGLEIKLDTIFQQMPSSLMKKKDESTISVEVSKLPTEEESFEKSQILEKENLGKKEKVPEAALIPIPTENTIESKPENPKDILSNQVLSDRDIELQNLQKLTLLQRSHRKTAFLQKYCYLSSMISQLFRDMMRAPFFKDFRNSTPNLTDDNIRMFIDNPYKLFSILLEGDIVSKAWLIKESNGNVKGPFLSFEMDLKLAKDELKEDMEISIVGMPYAPLIMYVERSVYVQDICRNYKRIKMSSIKPTELRSKNHKQGFKKNNRNQQYKQQVPAPKVNKPEAKPLALEKEREIFEENFPDLETTQSKTNKNKEPEIQTSSSKPVASSNVSKVKFNSLDELIKVVPKNLVTRKGENKNEKKSQFHNNRNYDIGKIQKANELSSSVEVAAKQALKQKRENDNEVKKVPIIEKEKELTKNIKSMLGL